MIEGNELREQQKINLVRKYSAEHMPKLPYHNFAHAVDVDNAVQVLAKAENLSLHYQFLLQAGAYLHDLIYEINAKDNEERSAVIAEEILPGMDYHPTEIYLIKLMILATKIPTNPKSKLEEVMCDADVDNLGRPDFFDKCELLRQERGVEDKRLWYANTLRFLQGHHYYTEAARNLRQKGFEENFRELRNLVDRT